MAPCWMLALLRCLLLSASVGALIAISGVSQHHHKDARTCATIHDEEVPTGTVNTVPHQFRHERFGFCTTKTYCKESTDSSDLEVGTEPEFEFDSLDVILERARKRKPGLLLQLQAAAHAPLLPPLFSFITRGDAALALVALCLGSTGFAIVLVFGKATTGPLRRFGWLPSPVLQLWPVELAILCDQLV